MAGIERQSKGIGDVVRGNLASGALVGAGTYLVGYVLTFVLAVIDGVESGSLWKTVGWVFYSAHNVDLQLTGSAGETTLTESVSLFEGGGGVSNLGSTVPVIVYFLVPVVALFVAGVVAYRVGDTDWLDLPKVALVGAMVLVGYLVLAVLGRFLFEQSRTLRAGGSVTSELSTSVAPELGTAVVIMGVVYPFVLGAIGALVAMAIDSGGQEPDEF